MRYHSFYFQLTWHTPLLAQGEAKGSNKVLAKTGKNKKEGVENKNSLKSKNGLLWREDHLLTNCEININNREKLDLRLTKKFIFDFAKMSTGFINWQTGLVSGTQGSKLLCHILVASILHLHFRLAEKLFSKQ